MLDVEKDNDNVKLSLAAAYLPAFLTWCVGAGVGKREGHPVSVRSINFQLVLYLNFGSK